MRTTFVWLDDCRPIEERWKRVAEPHVNLVRFMDADGLITWLQTEDAKSNDKLFISFDYDLGGWLTGYDVAEWIVKNNIKVDGFTVHSMHATYSLKISELLESNGYYRIKFGNDINK